MKEIWKEVKFSFEYENDMTVEVSNLGRIRSRSGERVGEPLKGSMINGYKAVSLKFFLKTDEKYKNKILFLRQQANKLSQSITKAKNTLKHHEKQFSKSEKAELQTQINHSEELLKSLLSNYKKERKKFDKARTKHFSILQHRLVAEYFCPKPSPEHKLVIHLNYNKVDNRAENLKWVTQAESIAHQQKSPIVIAEKAARKLKKNEPRNNKLSENTVAIIKKRINEGKLLSHLSKQFGVTHTQLLRIKRGQNWAHVKPAA